MTDPKRPDWKASLKYFSVYLAIFFLALVALTIGFVIEHIQPFTWLLSLLTVQPEKSAGLNSLIAHLFREGGVAGLIACGLAVTIERLSAKEFLRLAEDQRAAVIDQTLRLAAEERNVLKRDVFHSTFGSHLPEEIRDEIETQILTKSFIRQKMAMNYVLKPVVDVATRSNYVLVDFELTYEIVNLTTEKKEFTLKSAFRKSPIESLSEQAKFLRVDVAGAENPLTLIGETIPTKADQDFISLDCQTPVWVKPGPNNPTTVTIHSQSIKHFNGGLSYYNLEYHTCGLEVSVHVPGNGLKVYSGVTPGADWLGQTFHHRPDDGYHNWKLKRPLLAFQCLYVGWDPKKIPETIHPAAVAHEETLAAA